MENSQNVPKNKRILKTASYLGVVGILLTINESLGLVVNFRSAIVN